MQEVPPGGLKKLKKRLVFYSVSSSALILVGWANYISAACFRFDLITRASVTEDSRQTAYLCMAMTFTVLAIAFMWIVARRNMDLVNRGVWTHAKVGKISSLGKGGTRPVTFLYEVNGTSHKIKKDVPKIINSKYSADSRVWVVYDPEKPKRCEILLEPI
jgi:hypothetical protein